MKIAVPWPVKESGRLRVKEALSLWEDKESLLLCLVESCNDQFLDNYHTTILSRNSTSIGTKIAKCFIYDMVKTACDMFPNEDYYGFGNSDVTPVGSLIENNTEYDVLVYHRTDIREWDHRYRQPTSNLIPESLGLEIWELRQSGMDDRKIARQLNLKGVSPPTGEQEWTYAVIRKLFESQGNVFFWGQDLYIFRANVVERVLNEYLKGKDPILSTGGFDPRLTRWCMENLKGVRVLNKIFHKMHESEWTIDEVEYAHNGGDIPVNEQTLYYDHNFVASLCEQGQRGAIPKYIKHLIGRERPEMKSVMFSQKQ
jgi:hypothetical protein